MASPDVPGETLSAGHIFLARLAYLRARGREVLGEVLSRLSDDDQGTLRGMILPITWLPLALNDRLDAAIADVLARAGDREAVFLEMGRASAEAKLGGAHAVFLRPGNPHYILSTLPQNHRLNCSRGQMTYEKTGEKSAVGRMFDAGYTTGFTCLTNLGWIRRAIELSGGKDVAVVDRLCVARGHKHCEYVCKWR